MELSLFNLTFWFTDIALASFFVLIVLSIFYLAWNKLIGFFLKPKKELMTTWVDKVKYINLIQDLDHSDEEFAFKINSIIREFLAEISFCKDALYLTRSELNKFIPNKWANELFLIIEKLEFSSVKSINIKDFNALKTHIISLINSI